MTETEQELGQHFKAEADKILFDKIHFDSRIKNKVLQTVDSPRKRAGLLEWMASCQKKWVYGVAAVALIAIFAVSIPNLFNPNSMGNNGGSLSTPNTGNEGTGLTSLKTANLQTPEEARQLFGPDLLVPSFVPEGYQLTGIQAVGTEENTATQVIFTYTSGNQVFTFIEDKAAASLNSDYFDPIKVNGFDGYMNKDPLITELYWLTDGNQFSIIGSLSKDEAINMAESLQ